MEDLLDRATEGNRMNNTNWSKGSKVKGLSVKVQVKGGGNG